MGLSAGLKLGPYEIAGSLGRGGMGEVYRAKDSRLGRDVAIKVLPERLGSSPDALQRFEHEARTLAALSHPNILNIHDVGTDHGIFFVVMELLEGETLRTRISRSVLSWEKAIEIAIPIAEGLAAAHSKGVIHGDLKPENIFITSDGRTKILDFGLARFKPILPKSEVSESFTKSRGSEEGILRGTVPYISPEQARGGSITPASDIFSFGCVLYEMILGKQPFSRNTAVDSLVAILSDVPARLADSGKKIPPEFDRLIEHCLEKNVEMRFQSASDVAFDLKAILTTASINKTAGTHRRERLRRFRNLFLLSSMAIMVAVLLGIFYARSFRKTTVGIPRPENIKSLAVLPLRNLSKDPTLEYFVDGMTDELIANLGRIESLRVISTTSVMEYKGARKPLPQIAKELNVDAVIEGSVLPTADRVRITVQLIYAPTDRHLWSESYERNLSNILALQNEVASDITQKIKINLTPVEKRHLAKARTIRPDAYQAYLRGISLMNKRDLEGREARLAADMFERAVSLDPNFAVAYAELSRSLSTMYFLHDPSREHLLKAKAAVDRAFELQPGLPEAHVALGWYYYVGFQDYPQAIREFEMAEKDLPGSTILLESLAYARRRLGNFEAALKSLKKVHELSPRDSRIVWETAITCMDLRKYAEADHYYDKAISIAPGVTTYYTTKAENLLLWRGDTKTARATLNKIPNKEDEEADSVWFHVELFERNFEAALQHARHMRSRILEGMAYRITNREALARKSYDALRIELEKKMKLEEDPSLVSASHARLGIAYAALGRKEEGIREGKLAVEQYPVSKDALLGTEMLERLVSIYIMVGKYDEALDQIDYLLSIPCRFSVSWVRAHPLFDPLRNHPEYQKVLQKHR